MTSLHTQPKDLDAGQNLAGRMIAELNRESEATRRVLERVPEDRLTWKPHAKSMSLGQLALHLAQLPYGIAMLVERLRVEVPTVPLVQPASRREILDALERSVAYATERLTAWGDEDLEAPWTLTRDGAVLIARPRGEMLRTLMLNHTYHHRGQLTVYLRLLDVPLPPVYGPTADENPFA
ncbi:MAG: DinB family protein [Gemmatimonadaceae bacterium]